MHEIAVCMQFMMKLDGYVVWMKGIGDGVCQGEEAGAVG
jgi:hypothetical protein